MRALYERQIEFNYLTDEQLLKLGMPENGALAVAKQRYEAVLLDDALEYDEAALVALRTYAKQGLKIVHSAWALGGEWRTVRLSGSASGIRASHVKRGDEEFVLLANELGGDYSGTATLPFTGTVAVLDPWTGEAWQENAESGRLKVHLERRQLLYVCRCAGAEELPLKAPAGRIRETKPLDDSWRGRLAGDRSDTRILRQADRALRGDAAEGSGARGAVSGRRSRNGRGARERAGCGRAARAAVPRGRDALSEGGREPDRGGRNQFAGLSL